jgi:hypothetical protein
MLSDRVLLMLPILPRGSNKSNGSKCSWYSHAKPTGAIRASQVTWILGIQSEQAGMSSDRPGRPVHYVINIWRGSLY